MRRWTSMLVVGALLAGAFGSRAQAPPLGPPLHVGPTNGICDEFGCPLKGVNAAATLYGFTAVPGEIVQILMATNELFPPDVNGNPDPRNPILYSGSVGDGMDPTLGATSIFAISVPGRPLGAYVAARVFNKATLADSSFYQDSQLFYVNPNFSDGFTPVLSRTLTPLDTSDLDGDGLIGSWEESLGGDPDDPDSDGDGLDDYSEWRAGTELTNSLSLLLMVRLQPVGGDQMRVTWDSVTGKVYQVEYRPGDMLAATSAYVNVSSVLTGLSSSASVIVTNDVSEVGHYRVRLVEP